MNIESVPVGVKRDIGLGIFIGDSKLWAAYHEVTIEASDGVQPATETVTIKQV